jgi:hypothetical protein
LAADSGLRRPGQALIAGAYRQAVSREQAMITGEAGEREETLTVSWASLEKRKEQ